MEIKPAWLLEGVMSMFYRSDKLLTLILFAVAPHFFKSGHLLLLLSQSYTDTFFLDLQTWSSWRSEIKKCQKLWVLPGRLLLGHNYMPCTDCCPCSTAYVVRNHAHAFNYSWISTLFLL